MAVSMTKPCLIIHGGAGNITRENLPLEAYTRYEATLRTIHRSTSALLAKGATALDAATHAVTLFEDDKDFNCGKGAVFTRDGTIELEASVGSAFGISAFLSQFLARPGALGAISVPHSFPVDYLHAYRIGQYLFKSHHIQVMVSHGFHKRACGVVLVNKVKNPIKLAREMLIRGETDGSGGGNGGNGDPSGGSGGAQGHSCLGGDTVHKLAEEWGLEMVDESYFWTKKRWDQHRKGLRPDHTEGILHPTFPVAESGWDGKEYLPQGTVGCVTLDQYGTLCVATSTGGLTNKLSYRIGDTPTIGAGFWAEEWDESPFRRQETQPQTPAALNDFMNRLRNVLGDCLSSFSGYDMIPAIQTDSPEKSGKTDYPRAVAMSGTGNGDSFLRTAAARTAGAIVRFSPHRSLASAINQIAGPGGELQQSAGNRWGKTGEGEGGIIGIELAGGKGEAVFDFNCGGMFRCWIDAQGKERVMVFKDEY